ncbi:MAG: hybrid sensor histidine kinase/response regulator [Cyanobacteria bacterium]|nr:hybrid sensor histidine kinase/response regulator [Cyanobacteriota bacterium]MDW8200992.1 response regulator [Cyanobacteriota bacterium SKYGB_h_bin112]
MSNSTSSQNLPHQLAVSEPSPDVENFYPLISGDILIVDDVTDNIRLLSSVLKQHGHRVRMAVSGQMALTSAVTLPPDLILLDINMPGMNGYEVCRRLKTHENTRSVPVIFLSAMDDVLDKVKAFHAGAVDYVTKPFQTEEVLARVQTHLTIRALQTRLQQQNVQLQATLEELQQTQAQLVQREKMASVGQLVAGVAHEINNPISFIAGNLQPANEYVQSLVNLVKLYQQEYPQPSPQIQQAIQDIDLEFLMSDVQKLMASLQTGVDRIRNVILALRIFSRLGESDIKPVSLHEGIDSVLLVLHHRLLGEGDRPAIAITKSYGELPLVTCYASQINQVFLNLINNAIEAIERACQQGLTNQQRPQIWVITEQVSDTTVRIRIRDNGIGISEDVKSRLFDPFFTTKPASQGVGLGLSTSYQIVVERHKGTLTYESVPGQYTEFIVEIPINLPHL